jgi:hypothetical protein
MPFAPCPPRFALLLDLRKTHTPTAPASSCVHLPLELPSVEHPFSQHQARGGCFAEVKEEGPHGPGDTEQNTHPLPDAGERKSPLT